MAGVVGVCPVLLFLFFCIFLKSFFKRGKGVFVLVANYMVNTDALVEAVTESLC